jgi:hypothetical protein
MGAARSGCCEGDVCAPVFTSFDSTAQELCTLFESISASELQ